MRKTKKTFKLLAIILSAGILFAQMIIPASAESVFDEVYTNYYYKHSFVNGQTDQYCLSSDDSLEGYVEVGIGGNSADNPGLIGNSYMDLTGLTPEEFSEQVDFVDSALEFTNNNSCDSRVVWLVCTYPTGRQYACTGFIMQDWGGKSCIGTVAHGVYAGMYPNSIWVFNQDSSGKTSYICNIEAMHIPKQHLTSANTNVDYAMLTVNCGFSLSEKYGHFYLASIGENPSNTYVTVYALIPDGSDNFVTVYTDNGIIVESNDGKYYYDIQSDGGSSGSPVYITLDGTDFVVAIHSGLGNDSQGIPRGVGAYTKWSVTRFLAFNPFV